MARSSLGVREVLTAGVAMALGWGLRGSIGGGPLGALIPGAMIGLTLAFFYSVGFTAALRIGAISAVAVSFGGDMTYGQTIGLLREAPTFWWGLTGLTIKGAVWGMLAAPLIWVACQPELPSIRQAAPGFLLIVAGAALGWKFFNEPRIIYFSNPYDKPRPEIWFGLLLAAILTTAWFCRVFDSKGPARAAIIGAVGGGFGFGAGSLLMLLANQAGRVDGWKIMEYFFGFCLGIAFAVACRPSAESETQRPPGFAMYSLMALGLSAFAVGTEELSRFRFSWECTGCILLLLLWWRAALRHPAALTLPFLPTVIDFVEGAVRRPAPWPTPAIYGIALLLTAVFVVAAWRVATTRGALLLLMLACTSMAWLKFTPTSWAAAHVPLTMTAMALFVLVNLRTPDAPVQSSTSR